jgi:hypothetical protein
MLVLDMINILHPLGKYKYDTWRILLVKCYLDNYVRLQSCIQNVNSGGRVGGYPAAGDPPHSITGGGPV